MGRVGCVEDVGRAGGLSRVGGVGKDGGATNDDVSAIVCSVASTFAAVVCAGTSRVNRAIAGASAGDVVLFEDTGVAVIPNEKFAPLTRAGLRLVCDR